MRDHGLRFRFSLARELGMSVAQLDKSMTSQEYTHWQAYFMLENEEMEKKKRKTKRKPQAEPLDD